MAQDLPGGKSSRKYLHTGDSSPKIPSISNTSSHPDGVVSSQSYSTNILIGTEPIIDKQLGASCSLIVNCTNKLPLSRSYSSAGHRLCKTASPSTRKPCKQHFRCNHPEVYSPAIWHIVKDRPRVALMVDPRQECDGSSCVQPSSIWKLNITVGPSKEIIRATRFSIWTWSKSNVSDNSWWISETADISTTRS